MANPNDPAVGPSVVNPPAGTPSAHPSPGEAKLPEFLAGKMSQEEFASLPDSARAVLVAKVKDLQADYTRKTQELSESRKSLEGLAAIQEQMQADPKLAKHLDQALADYKSGKLNKQELQDEWDQLKEEADPAGLKVLTAIEKKFGDSQVKEKLEKLDGMLAQLISSQQGARKTQLEAEFSKLPAAFKSLAEEHRDTLVRLGMRPSFHQVSLRDLLPRVIPRESYENAFLQQKAAESQAETQRVQELAGFPSVAGTPETPVLTETDRIKSRDPRFGDGIRFNQVINRLVNEAKRHLPGGAV